MCVVIATLSVLSLRLFIQGRPGGKPWDGIVGGALNAIVIMIMNMVNCKALVILVVLAKDRRYFN